MKRIAIALFAVVMGAGLMVQDAEAAKRLAAIFRKKAQEAVAAGSTAGEGDATFRTSTGSALDNLFGK